MCDSWLSFQMADHISRLEELATRYADRSPDLADLCLIRMSELFPKHPVITTDLDDFQVYRRARADGVGLFYPSSEVLVISARVLRALRENEARGLRQYLPDPPIEFGVVEISS